MNKDIEDLMKVGFDEKEAKIYIASLDLGESSIAELAKKAKIKRTSAYYVVEGMVSKGLLIEIKRNNKTFFLPSSPRSILRQTRNNLSDLESAIDDLEDRRNAVVHKSRVFLLHGPAGFKQIWDMIFESGEKEYYIITEGDNFLDFVKEKYILDELITRKKKLGIRSRQLIVDSDYAREIVKKDVKENRESRFLPKRHKLYFTEIISKNFVAFISPRFNDSLFVIENEFFANTRKNIFDVTWDRFEK